MPFSCALRGSPGPGDSCVLEKLLLEKLSSSCETVTPTIAVGAEARSLACSWLRRSKTALPPAWSLTRLRIAVGFAFSSAAAMTVPVGCSVFIIHVMHSARTSCDRREATAS